MKDMPTDNQVLPAKVKFRFPQNLSTRSRHTRCQEYELSD